MLAYLNKSTPTSSVVVVLKKKSSVENFYAFSVMRK